MTFNITIVLSFVGREVLAFWSGGEVGGGKKSLKTTGLGDVGVLILGAGAGLDDVTGVVSGDDGGFLFSRGGMLGQSPLLLLSWMKLMPLQLHLFFLSMWLASILPPWVFSGVNRWLDEILCC